jgi:hypothetical protein
LYDNFEKKLDDSGERVLSISGIENGVSVSYFFEINQGLWYLIKIEDFST